MLSAEADNAAAAQEQSLAAAKKTKRFQCKSCERRFARLEHLQRHERIHTQEKPFGCQQCDHHFTRSDLLVRHERLTHKRDAPLDAENGGNADGDDLGHKPARKRRTTTHRSKESNEAKVSFSAQPTPIDPGGQDPLVTSAFSTPAIINHHDECGLTALSMAADYSTLSTVPDHHATPYSSLPTHNESVETFTDPLSLQGTGHIQGLGFEESLDSLAAFLDNEPLTSNHFTSLISAEHLPFFSPESFMNVDDCAPHSENQELPSFGKNYQHLEEPNTFSRFGSRLPSLQPEERDTLVNYPPLAGRSFAEVTSEDRQNILSKMHEFASVVAPDFQLPSRLALCRYLAAYINGFHEHLPFLHIATMSVETCAVELILAMAAVGAQYCFEGEKGVELFNASQAIASQRIRRRDARLVNYHHYSEADHPGNLHGRESSPAAERTPMDCSKPGPLGLPSEPAASSVLSLEREDLIQTAQALLVLMAMATWAKHKEILREALAIQSVLATLVRDDGLQNQPIPEDVTWEEWVRIETTKRTKLIVFCFFNLHCIVYNIPPLILNAEIKLTLPSSAAEFKAPNAIAWREARKKAPVVIEFQEALRRLFILGGRESPGWNSSLGNYVLIHALIQHIFFLRQVARLRYLGPGGLRSDEVSSLEQALRNWQIGWKRNPESSLDPMDPNGPVAFNSTALLRLAYIRLNVDTGPGRALDTRDPVQIANAFRKSPAIKRTSKLVRAVLHSAHALSVPVKIGIRLVAKSQTFIWSIQHSLCSLECAFLLSKWLQELSLPDPDPPISEDERRICALVKTMLDETEFGIPYMPLDSPETRKCLSAGVLRVWATIFKGAQTWAIVDVIGSSLNIYAEMLESG
ncbi:hypothetical protein F5884DRAFT_703514 [Xylogone sp. PMI_703]|nr:hypothetical protein F5884DRAFT_703514 [Xylogone sp. PMI_703]